MYEVHICRFSCILTFIKSLLVTEQMTGWIGGGGESVGVLGNFSSVLCESHGWPWMQVGLKPPQTSVASPLAVDRRLQCYRTD